MTLPVSSFQTFGNAGGASHQLRQENSPPHHTTVTVAGGGDEASLDNRDDSERKRRLVRRNKAKLDVAILSSGDPDSIRRLLAEIPEDDDEADENGNTALHNAAAAGKICAVEIIMEVRRSWLVVPNSDGDSPLHVAAAFGQRVTVSFLLSKIRRNNRHHSSSSKLEKSSSDSSGNLKDATALFAGESGVKLVHFLIAADLYDVALDILKLYPSLVWAKSVKWKTPMETLAEKPKAFRSGAEFGFNDLVVYFFLRAPNAGKYASGGDKQGSNWDSGPRDYVTRYKHNILQKRLYNLKLMHTHAVELLEFLIQQALDCSGEAGLQRADDHQHDHVMPILKSSTETAVRLGIVEFVEQILTHYPMAMLYLDDNGHSLFHQAVIHRQSGVFKLLSRTFSFPPRGKFSEDDTGNNFLHLVAEDIPAEKVCSPAMHIQSELKWFKTAELISDRRCGNTKNNGNQTPREVFTAKHERTVKAGGSWVKEIASNCATIAALIVTVAFAGCFTFPGGIDDEQGFPLLAGYFRFKAFVAFNSVALMASSISLLMFLKMLMSRCEEEDFFVTLPRLLIQSLLYLYVAIASILLTFASSLSLMITYFQGSSGRLPLLEWAPYIFCVVPISIFGFTYLRLWFEVATGKVFI